MNINPRTRSGKSALLYGIVHYDTRCVEYLLNHGADPLTPNTEKHADRTLLGRTLGKTLEAMLNAIDIHVVSRSQLQSELSKQLDDAARFEEWKVVKKLERFQARVSIELGER